VVVHSLLVEGSDLFFNRAEALLNIDFSKYSQATSIRALPGTLELPCGGTKEILGTLLVSGNWFAPFSPSGSGGNSVGKGGTP